MNLDQSEAMVEDALKRAISLSQKLDLNDCDSAVVSIAGLILNVAGMASISSEIDSLRTHNDLAGIWSSGD